MISLAAFLREECANDAPWHCSTLPADWCVALGRPDFASKWRGVSDVSECEALPAAAGGLLALWDEGIGDNLPVVTGLQSGDIAVISARGIEAGAIFTGERWVIRAARGLHFLAVDHVAVVKAWRP